MRGYRTNRKKILSMRATLMRGYRTNRKKVDYLKFIDDLEKLNKKYQKDVSDKKL